MKDTQPLAQNAEANRNYGALEDSDDLPFGHQPSTRKVMGLGKRYSTLWGNIMGMDRSEWDMNTAPVALLMGVLVVVGQQVAVLLITAKQLLPGALGMVNECIPEEMGGFAPAIACEWTKSFVRGFPIVAMSGALIVAQRILLSKRTYYMVMCHGGLLHFYKLNALSCRLFRILTFSLVMAGTHFLINITLMHHDKITFENAQQMQIDAELKKSMKLIGTQYVFPSAIFMLFFYSSYDISRSIMPFSKFFSSDPDAAKKHISKLAMVHEREVYSLFANNSPTALEEKSSDADDKEESVWLEVVAKGSQGKGVETPDDVFATMWTARVLLDPRMKDIQSKAFQAVFWMFFPGAFFLQACGLLFIGYHIVDDMRDIVQGKNLDDIMCIIGLSFNFIICWILVSRNCYAVCWRLWPKGNEIGEELENEEQREGIVEVSSEESA